MKQTPSKRSYLLLAGILLAAILIAVLTSSKPTAASDRATAAELQAGRSYLEALSRKDPALVDAALKERDEAKRARDRADLLDELCQDEANVWSLFDNYVLMGEALGSGFSVYGFFSEDRVLAGSSYTLRNVATSLDKAAALKPEVVFLCFGLNDLNSGNWPTPDSYARAMVEAVTLVRQRIPGVTVVVSSILPVQEKALRICQKWAEIPAYNEALEKACRKNSIEFANVSRLAAEHQDLWESDGYHLRSGFYRYWACSLIVPVEVPAYES